MTKSKNRQFAELARSTKLSELKDADIPAGLTISAYGATLVDDAHATAARTTLGSVIGTDVQAHSSVLDNTTASFTTALNTKLSGIEANATADQTAAEIRTLVESATDSNVFTDADHTKLNGIEASATADQTDAEIKTAYENNSDTNAFTDALQTKLNGIATSANNYVHPNHSGEVTSTADGATVIASNVVDEDNLKVSNSPTNGYFLSAQSGNTGGLTWAAVPAGYADSDVDTHINQSSASSGQYLQWNGSDYAWATVTDTNTTYSAGNGLSLSGTTFLMSGSYSGTLSATQFTATSDLAKKENLEVVTDALSKVETLTGYTYTMKEDGSRKAGLIAQDVEKILPEAVNGQEGNKSLDYSATIALLVNAIKELKAQIESK